MTYFTKQDLSDDYFNSIGFINGEFKPLKEITISPFDRGYLFGDSIYEVILCLAGGVTVDLNPHLDRLERSLALAKIDYLTCDQEKEKVKGYILELIQRNLSHYSDQRFAVYLQIGRNQVGPRNHVAQENQPISLLINTLSVVPQMKISELKGKSILCQEENRWTLPAAKTTMLLPNIIAKKIANDQGYQDALFIANNIVRESTSSNILIYTNSGEWVTPAADGKILNGITRQRIIALYKEKGVTITERDVSVEELKNSLGACLSSSTIMFQPIVKVDAQELNQGVIHPEVVKLVETYQQYLSHLELAPTVLK